MVESPRSKVEVNQPNTDGKFPWFGCLLFLALIAIVIFAVYSLYNWIFKPKADNVSNVNPVAEQSEGTDIANVQQATLQIEPIDDFIPNIEKYPVKDIQVHDLGFETGNVYYPVVFYEAWLDTETIPTEQYVKDLAKEFVAQVTAKYKVSKITIDLYRSKPTSDLYGGAYTLANIIWSPSESSNYDIYPGDYSTHKYSIVIKDSAATAKELAYSKPNVQVNTPTESSYYEIQYPSLDYEDLSYTDPYSGAECVRVQYRIWIKTNGKATRSAVQALARDLVAQVTGSFDINALSLFVYDGPNIYGEYSIASVDWAPYGDWALAHKVRTGDYRNHSYNIQMRY